jgi:hypothetical protein
MLKFTYDAFFLNLLYKIYLIEFSKTKVNINFLEIFILLFM